MTVVSITKDPEALTLTLVVDLAAPPARAWQLWADPRRLERWWGPPTWPATVVEHDLRAGGRVRYFMTGPTGETAHGWWKILSVEAPVSFEVEDGFADESGTPDPELPVTWMRVDLEATPTGTRATVLSRFASAEQMAQLVEMGMEEGMREAAGQMDAVLAAD